MAFIAITTSEINPGEPVAGTTQTKIKDNFDDHESRMTSLESGSATIYPPIIFRVNGFYADDGVLVGILKDTINFNLEIQGVFLIIDEAGISGTTELDILYKRGAGSYTSIFTTKPSVAFGAGNDAISSNAVLHSTNKLLQAGDFIRLDTTAVQLDGKSFTVRIDYVKS